MNIDDVVGAGAQVFCSITLGVAVQQKVWAGGDKGWRLGGSPNVSELNAHQEEQRVSGTGPSDCGNK
jgi:hypothetical protein